MADLFADLRGGFRMPDVRMNQGPLPSTAGGPAGSDGTADGKYNFNTELLSGVAPYAYGTAARPGSDRNYQQIPHRVAKIIPPLYVPEGTGRCKATNGPNKGPSSRKKMISHAVDQGDIAFAINLPAEHVHLLLAASESHVYDVGLQSLTPFCNLATINYLLAGLWRYGNQKDTYWNQLQTAFDCGPLSLVADGMLEKKWGTDDEEMKVHLIKNIEKDYPHLTPKNADEADWPMHVVLQSIRRLLRMCFLPFGICAGSEKQGGQHETGLAPVVAAVSHVTTMTIDGQNRDLVNFWRAHNLQAGDQLIYRLGFQETRSFTLNHYYKEQASSMFEDAGVFVLTPQLIPDVYTPRMRKSDKPNGNKFIEYFEFVRFDKSLKGLKRKQHEEEDTSSDDDQSQSLDSSTEKEKTNMMNTDMHNNISKHNYRWAGHWRIGQMMHFRGAHVKGGMRYNDDTLFLTGGLLQITFAPVWRACEDDGDGTSFADDMRQGYSSDGKLSKSNKRLPPNKEQKQRKEQNKREFVAQFPAMTSGPADIGSGQTGVRDGSGVGRRLTNLFAGLSDQGTDQAKQPGSGGKSAPAAPAAAAAAAAPEQAAENAVQAPVHAPVQAAQESVRDREAVKASAKARAVQGIGATMNAILPPGKRSKTLKERQPDGVDPVLDA